MLVRVYAADTRLGVRSLRCRLAAGSLICLEPDPRGRMGGRPPGKSNVGVPARDVGLGLGGKDCRNGLAGVMRWATKPDEGGVMSMPLCSLLANVLMSDVGRMRGEATRDTTGLGWMETSPATLGRGMAGVRTGVGCRAMLSTVLATVPSPLSVPSCRSVKTKHARLLASHAAIKRQTLVALVPLSDILTRGM